MKIRLYLLIFLALSLVCVNTAQAKIRKSTYVKEVSKIDWQLLTWTSAWRGTTKPADPFILERMEYKGHKGKDKKVCVYLQGEIKQATDENLKKSVDAILSTIQQDFPEIDKGDLFVHYQLESKEDDKEKKRKTMEITYEDGSFSRSDITEAKDATTTASPSY